MDWKNNPLVAAATAVVATTAFLLAVFFTAVIPTWVKHLEREIADQQHEIAGLRKELGDFGTASEVLQAKSNKIIELEGELVKYRVGWNTVFRAGSPYPIDFANIKIGTPISEVERNYSFNRENIKIKNHWVEMNFHSSSGLFREITMYYDSAKPSPVITSLLFFFNTQEAFKAVLSDGLKNFGTGAFIYEKGVDGDEDKEENWRWKNIGGMEVTIYRNRFAVGPH